MTTAARPRQRTRRWWTWASPWRSPTWSGGRHRVDTSASSGSSTRCRRARRRRSRFDRFRCPGRASARRAYCATSVAARSIRSDVDPRDGRRPLRAAAASRRAVRVLTIHDLASLNRTTGFRQARAAVALVHVAARSSGRGDHGERGDSASARLRVRLRRRQGDRHRESARRAGFTGVEPWPARLRHVAREPRWCSRSAPAPTRTCMGTAEAVPARGRSLRIVGKLDAETNAAPAG